MKCFDKIFNHNLSRIIYAINIHLYLVQHPHIALDMIERCVNVGQRCLTLGNVVTTLSITTLPNVWQSCPTLPNKGCIRLNVVRTLCKVVEEP